MNSEELAEHFLTEVVNINNEGVPLDYIDEMPYTKFCGVPKLFLAKKLGRKYGILLYEKQDLINNVKEIKLYIDTASARKLCLNNAARPRNSKMVKCYIGANILTRNQILTYIQEHQLPAPVQVVNSQRDINAVPNRSKISFFIEPSQQEVIDRTARLNNIRNDYEVIDDKCREMENIGNRRIGSSLRRAQLDAVRAYPSSSERRRVSEARRSAEARRNQPRLPRSSERRRQEEMDDLFRFEYESPVLGRPASSAERGILNGLNLPGSGQRQRARTPQVDEEELERNMKELFPRL